MAPVAETRYASDVIKYIGSKRLLVDRIVALAQQLPDVRSVLDVFSGTARVGHAFKRLGYSVTANDHNSYAHTLAHCYVQADSTQWLQPATELIAELNALPGEPGYFTETFCERSRFFQPHNGARIDAIRDAIETRNLPPDLRAIALVSLMEAADRVDSTCGLQMAYLKQWAARASNTMQLRVPDVLPGEGLALELDAVDAARQSPSDLTYLDPPYNQHKYLGNYHVWESLVRWDKPEVYGIACKRIDCKERSSDFNSKPRIADAMKATLDALRTRHMIVSFNNEGYLSEGLITELLSERGRVDVLQVDYKRYVGAQIGIYNPSGARVGNVSHLRNRELLFVVSCSNVD